MILLCAEIIFVGGWAQMPTPHRRATSIPSVPVVVQEPEHLEAPGQVERESKNESKIPISGRRGPLIRNFFYRVDFLPHTLPEAMWGR